MSTCVAHETRATLASQTSLSYFVLTMGDVLWPGHRRQYTISMALPSPKADKETTLVVALTRTLDLKRGQGGGYFFGFAKGHNGPRAISKIMMWVLIVVCS